MFEDAAPVFIDPPADKAAESSPQGEPRFLVQDKTVSHIRLSFFDNYLKAGTAGQILDKARMLVVGNPVNDRLSFLLGPLEASAQEAREEETAKQNNASAAEKDRQRIAKYQPFVEFCGSTFTTKSPLNGFLYMSFSGQEKHDVVPTLGEILEMPDSSFGKARLAVLPACNTAVTYSPKIGKGLRPNWSRIRSAPSWLNRAGRPGWTRSV